MNLPPDRLPRLTEVVNPEAEDATQPMALYPADAAPPLPAEDELTERVLTDVSRQVELMLEYRLREALGPALARATDALVREARNELAQTLRDVISRAVNQELARHRGPDPTR